MSFLEEYGELLVQGDKKALLDYLNNAMCFDSPDGGMQVAYLDASRGRASKWRPWLEVRDSPWWVEKINNRLVGIPELVFDFDPAPNETPYDFAERVKRAVHKIIDDRATTLGVFSTGSRGVHMHVLIPGLAMQNKQVAQEIKRFLLQRYGADTAKSSLRTMIAIEVGTPHWKTGKCKTEVLL